MSSSVAPVAAQRKRDLFLLEIERGVTLKWALRHVGWTGTGYWSQRHRHRRWAYEVDRPMRRTWEAGTRGSARPLYGRAIRGALRRRDFLELIEDGKAPWEARGLLDWSGPAYYQARYRNREWADQVD